MMTRMTVLFSWRSLLGALTLTAAAGAILGPSGCGEPSCVESECRRQHARDYDPCKEGRCVGSTCELVVLDNPAPWALGDVPGDCLTALCVDGEYTLRADDLDAPDPPESAPSACYHEACVNGTLSDVASPAGAPCPNMLDGYTGLCDGVGTCEQHPPQPCDDYCAFLAHEGCAEHQHCPEWCVAGMQSDSYCIPEQASYYTCAIEEGLCWGEPTDPCAEELADYEACASPCDYDCMNVHTQSGSCTCFGGCNEHMWELVCDDSDDADETCQCILDGTLLGTCTEEEHDCSSIGCCAMFLKSFF
jgi:hypothetical protein